MIDFSEAMKLKFLFARLFNRKFFKLEVIKLKSS